MKNNDLLYLGLGALVLYLLAKNAFDQSAAQQAINTTNLNAAGTIANVNTAANAANLIGGDLSNVVTDFGY